MTMTNYITYSVDGLALRQHDVQPPEAPHRYCVRFEEFDRAIAAWVADADVRQAIRGFGGEEVYGAFKRNLPSV